MIREVSLRNWRSHGEKEGSYGTTVVFQEGLNVIYGINGSGKSSIAEAIAYGLFGITSQPMRDILRIGTKRGSVKVLFSSDTLYEVRRDFDAKGTLDAELFMIGGRRVPLVLGRSKDVDRKVEELTGISKRLYQQILYASQNALFEIFEKTPSERTKELDRLLGLESLQKARDLLSSLRNTLQRELKGKDVLSLERERERLENALRSLEEEVKVLLKRRADLERKRDETVSHLETLRKKLSELTDRVREFRKLSDEKRRLEGEIKALEESITHPDATKEDEKRYLEMEEKARHLESMEYRRRELLSILRTLEDELSKLPEIVERPHPEEVRAKLQEEERKLQSVEKSLRRLREEVVKLESELYRLKQEKEDLLKKKERLEELKSRRDSILSSVKKELTVVEERLGELRRRLGVLEGERSLLDSLSEDLLSLGRCPVCGSELKSEDVQRVIAESQKKRSKIENEIRKLRAEMEKLEGRHRELQRSLGIVEQITKQIDEIEEELLKLPDLELKITSVNQKLTDLRKTLEVEEKKIEELREVVEKLRQSYLEEEKKLQVYTRRKEVETNLEKVKNELVELERKIKELMEPYGSLEELKNLLDDLRRRAESWRVIMRLESLKKRLLEVSSLLEPLMGVEEQYEELRAGVGEEEKKLVEVGKELEKVEELLKVKEEQEEELRRQQERVVEEIDRVKRLERATRVLSKLLSAWDEAFRRVRNARVERINEAVNLIWRRLYTNLYADYEKLELRVEESRRGYAYYFLALLKTPRGPVWRDISTLSGGERTAAVIAFRIALAYLLSGRSGFLILDEPTHNLDERLTEGLASFLRQAVEDDGLFSQIIVITHDPVFADYADVVYEVRRKKEGNDPAQVIRIK